MEEALSYHQDVAECAVIGVNDEIKGELPLGLIVLKANAECEESKLVGELVDLVREEIGPVAAFKTAAVVKRLPKTRSGKILRGIMRKIANGQEYKVPATIDDPAILDEITDVLKKVGYPKK
jgi:propionyl-CoA synthetase